MGYRELTVEESDWFFVFTVKRKVPSTCREVDSAISPPRAQKERWIGPRRCSRADLRPSTSSDDSRVPRLNCQRSTVCRSWKSGCSNHWMSHWMNCSTHCHYPDNESSSLPSSLSQPFALKNADVAASQNRKTRASVLSSRLSNERAQRTRKEYLETPVG